MIIRVPFSCAGKDKHIAHARALPERASERHFTRAEEAAGMVCSILPVFSSEKHFVHSGLFFQTLARYQRGLEAQRRRQEREAQEKAEMKRKAEAEAKKAQEMAVRKEQVHTA